jgi:hypothetical protein
MNENRSSPRQRVLKAATIALRHGGAITSTVKNLSQRGAMLQIENVLGIPDEFTLIIQADNFKRACRVVWKKPSRIGVRFV